MTDRSTAPLPLPDLIADLVAEQQALDDVMAPLGDHDWATATASPGWSVGDQIAHHTHFDRTAAQALAASEALLEKGAGEGLRPTGLGARDTLRLEKGYLLSGQDFIWPGLGVSAEKPLPEDFLYRDTAETSVPFGLDMEHDFIGRVV